MLFRLVDLLFVSFLKDRPNPTHSSRWLVQTRAFNNPFVPTWKSSRHPVVLHAMTNDEDGRNGFGPDDSDYWCDIQKLASLPEIQQLLTFVVEENVEAVRCATILIEDGVELARKNRKSLFDSKISENMMACYQKLNLLLTNMAIDNVRTTYISKNKLQARDYLDSFVATIDSSQTVTRLLSQAPSPIRRTSDAATARYKRNFGTGADTELISSADVSRHFVEQLMFEGLKSHQENTMQGLNGVNKGRGPATSAGGPGSAGKTGPNAASSAADERSRMMAERKSKYADTFAKRISDELEADKVKGLVDVLSIAQDVIDERAELSQLLSTKMTELINMNLKTSTEIALYLAKITLPAGSTAAVRRTTRYLSPPDGTLPASMGPVRSEDCEDSEEGKEGPLATEISLQDDDLDPDSTGVSAGFASGDDNTEGGQTDEGFGRAVSNVFGSIFGGLVGSNDKDKKGWREEDPTQTKTDADGVRKKTSVGLMDPPDRPRPPKPVRDRDDGNDEDEKRNPVDYGDDAPDGDMSAFNQLGPGASIRVASQKEEEGSKYLLLEGKSQPMMGPNGMQVRVIRQWVAYDQAVAFLKGGFEELDGPRSADGSTPNSANTLSGDNNDEEDDGSSPFFGGSVQLM